MRKGCINQVALNTTAFDVKRLLTLLALTTAVLCPLKTAMGGGPVPIDEVRIEPNEPTITDSITIHVSGHSGASPVWIDDSNFLVQGPSLELDIFLTVGPYAMPTSWYHSEPIGALPAGSYDLTVRGYSFNQSTKEYDLTDTYSISFTVIADNSNSKIEDGIEYYVQADKAIYILGEEVQMLYKVTNLRDEDVTFTFPHTPVWNFWVQQDGNDIWKAVNRWWAMPTQFTLGPDESAEFPDVNSPYIWNMRDKEGDLVDAGDYEATGGFDAMSPAYEETKVSVPITIIPEPPDVVELPLACEGAYVPMDTWTMDFDLGVTFTEITNIYIDWCGAIAAEVVYWADEPNDTFPVDAKFSAGVYKSGEFAGGTYVRAGEDTYPEPEAFDLQSPFPPFGQNWNMFLDGQGTIKIGFYTFPHYGNLYTLVDPNGRINCATLVFEGTIAPEPPIGVEVEIHPDTLNLKSKGKWISCKIWLPEDHNVVDVNSYTVLLQNEVPAEWIWFNERQNLVMAKFRRLDVEEIIQPGLVELTVTGELLDGTPFEGRDTIRVIDKGKTKQLTRKHRP